ncbi:MAG: NAD(+) diphosphatase [bacterium]
MSRQPPASIYEKFKPGVTPPDNQTAPALWFIFKKNKLLLYQDAADLRIPNLVDLNKLPLQPLRQNYMGKFDEQCCFAVELAEKSQALPGTTFLGLRQVFGQIDDALFTLAGQAFQIVDWDRTHQFCGQCGGATVSSTTERVKNCPACGLTSYPRLAPAIIVLIYRGKQLLLSRSAHFQSGMFSVQAGFVEPGETLEEAVAREVQEEVGLTLKNIQYFGSQPWPFPNSLMIGFTAEYAGGELRINRSEIEDAAWFTADNLPKIPGTISIARQLIDHFLELNELNKKTLSG